MGWTLKLENLREAPRKRAAIARICGSSDRDPMYAMRSGADDDEAAGAFAGDKLAVASSDTSMPVAEASDVGGGGGGGGVARREALDTPPPPP